MMNRFHALAALLALAPAATVAAPLISPSPSGPQLTAPLTLPSRTSPPQRQGQASPAAEAYQRGIEGLAADDLDAAQRDFRRALELQPGFANALLGLAEVASRRNRPDEAATLIRDAVKAEPGNAHAHASLGRLQATRRQFTEAEASLKKAAELDPKLVRAKMDLADLYATTFRKPREALALYRNVLEIDPDHAGASYAAGIVLAGLGEAEAARQALETASRREPANPLPMMALARLAAQGKDLDGALRWADRAVSAAPAFPDALELRGDLWQLRRDADRALADYAAALRAKPQAVGVLIKQGSLLQSLGRTEAAAEAYQSAIKQDPSAAVAFNNLAWMAAESGKNLEQAEKWARRAVELGPNVPDFHDTLGWLQRARGQLKAAEKTLLQATSLKGAPAGTFYHLGVVQRELGKSSEAAAAFGKALALDKNHEKAAIALQELSRR
jgi:tetratricopeptide (TPR) repeat protein